MAPWWPARAQGSARGVKWRGPKTGLRQWEAPHQGPPATAMSSLWGGPPTVSQRARSASAVDVGGTSSGGRPAAATSQLIPMTGTTTRGQALVWEQPREGLAAPVKTNNSVDPLPAAPAGADVP